MIWEMHTTVRDAASDTYGARDLLDKALLRTVHDVNRLFLMQAGLLLDSPEASGLDRLGKLRVLDGAPPGVVDRAAGCSYTLFTMKFDDVEFWRQVRAEGLGVPVLRPAAGGFARAAAFLIWHVVRTRARAACLILGARPEVVKIWQATPVSALDPVAALMVPHVHARWAHHPTFWPNLATAAQAGTPRQLLQARRFGAQLLAAEARRLRFAVSPKPAAH